MSKLIPNTFQFPKYYIDEIGDLLTADEMLVVLYIARHTFGYNKESDQIAMSQFMNGIRNKDGKRVDGGVNLTKYRLKEALKMLIACNIVVVIREAITSPPSQRKATEYALQFDSDSVEWRLLHARKFQGK